MNNLNNIISSVFNNFIFEIYDETVADKFKDKIIKHLEDKYPLLKNDLKHDINVYMDTNNNDSLKIEIGDRLYKLFELYYPESII